MDTTTASALELRSRPWESRPSTPKISCRGVRVSGRVITVYKSVLRDARYRRLWYPSWLFLTPHFHVLVPEAVLESVPQMGPEADALVGCPHSLPPPDDEEVERLLRTVALRVVRLLRKQGSIRSANRVRSVGVGGATWPSMIEVLANKPKPFRFSAVAYTLLGCCALAEVDPVEYLADVLPRLTTKPGRLRDMPALLPAQWKAAREARSSRC